MMQYHHLALRLNIISFGRSAAGLELIVPGPPPATNLRHVVAVPVDVLLVIDELVVNRLLEIRKRAPSCGNRSTTSSHRCNRSSSFITAMSNGVVVVPSSCVT